MAPLRRLPSLRPPGRAGWPHARSAGRRAHAVRAPGRRRVAAPRPGQPGVRRPGREPAGTAERGRRLGLHSVVVEGDRRREPRSRDPHDVLRRRPAGRDGHGVRRTDGAGRRGRHSAAPVGRRSNRASRWPIRARPMWPSCSESSGSPSPWSRCQPSSSTAATSTCRIVWLWWSDCASVLRPATSRRQTTQCSDWPPNSIPPSVRQRRSRESRRSTPERTPRRTGAFTERSSEPFGKVTCQDP